MQIINCLSDWSKATQDVCIDLWKRGYGKEAGISLTPSIRVTTEVEDTKPHWLDITIGHSILHEDYLEYLRKIHKRNYT